MIMKVENKVALITGANRGIGKAILEAFIGADASKIYAAVRDVSSVQSLVDTYGDKVVPLEVDLSKPETITAAAKVATDVEILVNNAGILKNATPLDPHAIETFQFEIDVNVFGLIRVTQAFAPILQANGGGALVQLNSVASMKNFSDFATYSASKAAAYSITQGIRDKLKPQGTLVVSVHPGPIATDMANDAGIGDIAEPASLVGDSILEALESESFHAFPDTMAKQMGGAYASFAQNVVEADFSEA
ncbi:MAG: SDR family oxidoreductase [Verrucomicrobiota bacterium]